MNPKFGKNYPAVINRSEREKLLMLGAACLAVALFVLVIVLTNLRTDSLDARSNDTAKVIAPLSGTVTLFAPDRPVKAGTNLAEINFRQVYWPRNQVPADAVLDRSEFANQFAKSDLQTDKPITRALITSEPSHVSTVNITPGNRAVTIQVDDIASIEGHAGPGSKVDVVLTYTENGTLRSKIIVENARVVSYGGLTTPVNQASPLGPEMKPVISRTITLDVSVEDALKLPTAAKMGNLSLFMRDPDDKESVKTKDIDGHEIEGNSKAPANTNAACSRGTIKMGDTEYILDCNGKISAAESEYEP